MTDFRLPAVLAVLLSAFSAWAHPNLQNALWVSFEPETVRLAVNVTAREISVAQQVGLPGADSIPGEFAFAAEAHKSYLLSHLELSCNGKALAGKFVKLSPPAATGDPESTFYQYELEYPLGGPAPAEVSFLHSMLKEWPYAAGTPWSVSYVVRSKRSDRDGVATGLLRFAETMAVPTGWGNAGGGSARSGPGVVRIAGEYVHHGFMHIVTGYDHLLFVTALVIATLGFKEMFKVILAFTVAHTLTLALSVFDLVRLPSFLVEPVIAASIVYVALENILRPHRAHSRSRLLVAFGFGLIHGLGFAGGLLEAMEGLPRLGIWVSLAAFSLGVEIGHQTVVLPLFGLLRLTRRGASPGRQRSLTRGASALIACCGAYYLAVALREAMA